VVQPQSIGPLRELDDLVEPFWDRPMTTVDGLGLEVVSEAMPMSVIVGRGKVVAQALAGCRVASFAPAKKVRPPSSWLAGTVPQFTAVRGVSELGVELELGGERPPRDRDDARHNHPLNR